MGKITERCPYHLRNFLGWVEYHTRNNLEHFEGVGFNLMDTEFFYFPDPCLLAISYINIFSWNIQDMSDWDWDTETETSLFNTTWHYTDAWYQTYWTWHKRQLAQLFHAWLDRFARCGGCLHYQSASFSSMVWWQCNDVTSICFRWVPSASSNR